MISCTRSMNALALVLALPIHGCACESSGLDALDAGLDPTIDARGPDAWERIDAARDDAGPDAYDPAADPCVTAPRSAACARELIRGIDAAFCEGELACGRPVSEEGCEVYFPPEGSRVLRASEAELTMVRLGLLEIVPETVACLHERMRTCSTEDPATCGPLFRPVLEPMEGQPCRHDTQCGVDMYCDGSDSDTPGPVRDPFALCWSGECRARLADGENCEPDGASRYRSQATCRPGSLCIVGFCAHITRTEPAELRDVCGFIGGPGSTTFAPCREGVCRSNSADVPERCLPVVAIGESCVEAECGADAMCVDGRCVARTLFGDPCLMDEPGWCNWSAFGSACVDGVCVANDRRIGDPCESHDRQPCTEGVCAYDEEDPGGPYTCHPSLRSPTGGPCRRSDADCLDGACCGDVCISLGGLS